MKARSPKNKGKRLQNLVRDRLRSVFMETLEKNDIESQVMGMSGEDIILTPAAKKIINYSFECKNKERLDLWKSLEQAESNSEDRNPALVFKRNRSKIYITIEFDHFIELIDKLKEK